MDRRLLPALALLAACTEGEIAVLDLEDAVLPAPAEYAPGRVMLGFDGEPPAELDAAGLHLEALRLHPDLRVGLYALPAGAEVADAVDRLRATDLFAAVDADLRVAASTTGVIYGNSTDTYREYQWNLDRLAINDAWRESLGEGVTVAVVDSGVSAGPDGFDSLLPGWDFVNDDDDPADDNGHGTHVAGTVAQRSGNGVGCAGMAPLASVLPVKVLDASGSGYLSDVVAGIAYAVDHGADVVNLSLGSSGSSTTLATAVLTARIRGTVVVAASGNDGASVVSYPAALPGVIAVGAVDAADDRTWYSNAGPELDLVAPGGDNKADLDGDGVADGILQETLAGGAWSYRLYQGTSMATPHVSGAFALLLGAGASRDAAEAALLGTAADLGSAGRDDDYGYGLIQPVEALATVEREVDTTPPVISDVTLTDAGRGVLRVAWTTDEPATSALCKTDGSECVESEEGLATEHTAHARRSGRWFVLTATDEAGNTATSGPHSLKL
jgi:subtilisin family serine protease